jgi:vacuolar protein-sorting-associated protein 4
MNLIEIPEPLKLQPPLVTRDDFVKALSKIKPTVSAHDLLRQEEFTKNFGQDG